jgi:sugar diacid utilization regulator
MSEVVVRPLDDMVVARGALHVVSDGELPNDAGDRPDVIAAFCGLVDAFDPQHDVDSALRLVAGAAIRLMGIGRCCVYLKDQDSELFRGRVAVSGAPGDDERVRRLVCGTDGDGFTREIVQRGEPVFIADARSDPRPVRAAMHDWGVRSVLGVPMLSRDQVIGILFLDDAENRHEFSPLEQVAAATFGRLAGVALTHALRTEQLRFAMQTTARQNESLKRAGALDEQLTQELVDARGVIEIAATVAAVTGRHCAIYDASLRSLGTGEPPNANRDVLRPLDRVIDRLPAVRALLDGTAPRPIAIIDPLPAEGLMHRVLVAPVRIATRAIGFVALCETGTRFSAADVAAARRMAMAVGIDFGLRRQTRIDFAHDREVLLRDLIAGTSDPGQAMTRASYVDLRLDQPCLLGVMQRRSACGPPLTTQAVAAACVAQRIAHWEGALTAEAGGIVLVLPLEQAEPSPAAIAKAKHHLNAVALELSGDGEVLASLSTVCAGPGDFRRAFEESRQVLRCLEHLGSGGSRACSLAADDLGAARLFLSAADPVEARRFRADVLGPLEDVSDPRALDLLLTAQSFYDNGRSVRRTAAHLNVHGNTVRYRLSRIEQLTGRDIVGDARHQLDFLVALMVLSLERRVPRDIVARLD